MRHEVRFSGFGGQGVLSLGLVIAEAAGEGGRYVSWLPSYGPEQRGGSASCSVVMSGQPVGSPTVDRPDVLVCMNQPALEKFGSTVNQGGVLIYEQSLPVKPEVRNDIRLIAFPAMKVATENGVPKAANTAFLGCMSALGLTGSPEEHVIEALAESFASKPALVEKNKKVFDAAKLWVDQNIK